jgi:hypothetical protein
MSSEQHEPIEAPTAGAAAFEDCDYTVEQTKRILAVGATTFFAKVLPELESYLRGTRRIITGQPFRKGHGRLADRQRVQGNQ